MLGRPILCRLLPPPRPFSTCRRQRSPSIPHLDPPIPKKIPLAASAHGQIWEDPYRWMSDTADPDLSDHLLRENLYAEAFMADAEGLQRTLAAEMRARMPLRISTPPEAWGNWYALIPHTIVVERNLSQDYGRDTPGAQQRCALCAGKYA